MKDDPGSLEIEAQLGMMDVPAFMRFAFGGEHALIRINQQFVNRRTESAPCEKPVFFGHWFPANESEREYCRIDRRRLPNAAEHIFGEFRKRGRFRGEYVGTVQRNFTPALSQGSCARWERRLPLRYRKNSDILKTAKVADERRSEVRRGRER